MDPHNNDLHVVNASTNVDAGPWAIAVDYLVQALNSSTRGLSFQTGKQAQNTNSNSIAVISIDGTMSRGGSFYGGTSTAFVGQQLKAAGNDPNIKGVVLAVNSPGGYVAGTKELADIVASVKQTKPVYASISDIGASAAYWVSSQASKVFAEPDAVVGSIGTYTVIPDMSRLAENAGVTVHVIRADQSGEHKGAGVPGAPVSEAQLQEIKRLVTARNEFFLSAVQQGRGISKASLAQVADGRLFMASEAVDLGLVDEVASTEMVISKLIDATSSVASKGVFSMENVVNEIGQAKTAEVMESSPTASIADRVAGLRLACPGASAEQLLAWLESGTTDLVAQSSYVQTLVQAVADLTAKVNSSANVAAASAAKVNFENHVIGVNPIGNRSSTVESAHGSAKSEWDAQVALLVSQGMTKRQAVGKLRYDNQTLTEAYIAEVNGRA